MLDSPAGPTTGPAVLLPRTGGKAVLAHAQIPGKGPQIYSSVEGMSKSVWPLVKPHRCRLPQEQALTSRQLGLSTSVLGDRIQASRQHVTMFYCVEKPYSSSGPIPLAPSEPMDFTLGLRPLDD